jgi:hypothetical protein
MEKHRHQQKTKLRYRNALLEIRVCKQTIFVGRSYFVHKKRVLLSCPVVSVSHHDTAFTTKDTTAIPPTYPKDTKRWLIYDQHEPMQGYYNYRR